MAILLFLNEKRIPKSVIKSLFQKTLYLLILTRIWHEPNSISINLLHFAYHEWKLHTLTKSGYLLSSVRIEGRELRGSKGPFTNYVDKFLSFFWPPTPFGWHFLPYNSWPKWKFLTNLTPSSCKRSLWTTPKHCQHFCTKTHVIYRYINLNWFCQHV